MTSENDRPVVLFDGVCNLCNGAVQFLLTHDPHRRLRFAALQSAPGRALLLSRGRGDLLDLQSLVLVAGGEVYTRSTAVLRILRLLPAPWPWLSILLLVPRPLRDGAYRLLAHNRYRWFGQQQVCWVPTPALKAQFL